MTNDDSANETPLRPPLTTTTSIKPAASVLLIAIATLFIFIVVNAIGDRVSPSTDTTVLVVGGLRADPTSAVLKPCLIPGAPPENIAPAYVVPLGTVATSHSVNLFTDPGAYDCARRLQAPHPQSEILGFYRSRFVAQGWTLFSQGAAAGGGGEQFLFRKAGSDSFFWVSGVTINRHSSTSTTWTLRFYQNSSSD